MATKQKSGKKVKKKRWFPIVAPKLLGEKLLGDSLLIDPSLLESKPMTLNLMTITGDPKRQHINLIFKVNKVVDGKGHTEVLGYFMSASSVKRLVRRDRAKIDDSFLSVTSDKKVVRVKPLIITSYKAKKNILTKIRLAARKIIHDVLAQNTFDTILTDLINYKLQRFLRDSVSKVFPIRTCEIRSFKLETKDLNVKKELSRSKTRAERAAKQETEKASEEVDEESQPVEEGTTETEQKKPETKNEPEDVKEEAPEAKEDAAEEKVEAEEGEEKEEAAEEKVEAEEGEEKKEEAEVEEEGKDAEESKEEKKEEAKEVPEAKEEKKKKPAAKKTAKKKTTTTKSKSNKKKSEDK